MAVTGDADRIVFYLTNEFKSRVDPPIVFSDFHDDSYFSFSIWVKVSDKTVGDVLLEIDGPDGSKFIIQHGGGPWYYHLRKETVAIYAQAILTPVQEGVYTVFCVSKEGPRLRIYVATEVAPDAADTHVNLILAEDIVPGFEFDFQHIAIVARNQWAICNFKYWNHPMEWTEFKEQVHYWDWVPRTGIPGADKVPIWSSPLRTPGDISNIAHPSTGPNWQWKHAYDLITPYHVPLKFVPDPAFMAKWTECPTWLYELSIRGTITTFGPQGIQNFPIISATLPQTPLVITDVIGDKFVDFQDRGSVPANPTEWLGVKYYGYPSRTSTVAAGPAGSWGYFFDELGNPQSSKDPLNAFEPDTEVTIPTGVLLADKLYLWRYGAFFTWNPATPQQPAGTGHLQYMFLYVRYRGYPTALPTLPVEDLAGLFAIKKGQLVDRYSRGVELKIPDPTIRTAYLGE